MFERSADRATQAPATVVPTYCVSVGTSKADRETDQTVRFHSRAHGSGITHKGLVRQRKNTRVREAVRYPGVGAQRQFWTIVLYIPALVGAFTFSLSLLVCCMSMNVITVRV